MTPPTLGGVGTGPDGRVTNNPRAAQSGNSVPMSSAGCAALAMRYAMLNNRQRFIELTQQANRYNVSFYPFDTRGLAAFDADLGARDDRIRGDQGEWYNRQSPNAPGSMMADRDRLNVRLDSLRLLADNTDGLAVINTNDLDARRGPDRPRPLVVLPARVLLGQRTARRQVAHDQGAREAPGRGGAGAQGLSRAPPRRHAHGITLGAPPRRQAAPATPQPRRKARRSPPHSVR